MSALGSGASAHASERGLARAERVIRDLVKADVVSRGLKSPDKVIIVGDSFQVLAVQSLAGAHAAARPIERVLATGTLDRATGKVTSFNPILLE